MHIKAQGQSGTISIILGETTFHLEKGGLGASVSLFFTVMVMKGPLIQKSDELINLHK